MSEPSRDAADCDHEEFHTDVVVNRLVDSGLFAAEFKVRCADCWIDFVFPDSVPIGLDLHGVARDLHGVELRVAIRPIDHPLPNPIEEIAP